MLNSIPKCSQRWKQDDKSRLHQRTSVIRCCFLLALCVCHNRSTLRLYKNKSVPLFAIILDIKLSKSEKTVLLQKRQFFISPYMSPFGDNSNYPIISQFALFFVMIIFHLNAYYGKVLRDKHVE